MRCHATHIETHREARTWLDRGLPKRVQRVNTRSKPQVSDLSDLNEQLLVPLQHLDIGTQLQKQAPGVNHGAEAGIGDLTPLAGCIREVLHLQEARLSDTRSAWCVERSKQARFIALSLSLSQ